MVIISYVCYLCSAIFCSEIKDYLENMKKYDQYQETYDQMTAGKGYFKFHIECYHYVSSGSGKNRRRRKVVTHTAN